MDRPWKSTPISILLPNFNISTSLPKGLVAVLETLWTAGFEAYLVGGCVRDFLFGLEAKDFDLACSAQPDDLDRLFKGNSRWVGRHFGVLKVQLKNSPIEVELACFRSDGTYHDGRRPKTVHFGDPIEDILRRDFTINGLYLDLQDASILDACQGLEDIQTRCLRAIGNPSLRFTEDALRLLRAIRFVGRFDLELEAQTKDAIIRFAGGLKRISCERICAELESILKGPGTKKALGLMQDLGLADPIGMKLKEGWSLGSNWPKAQTFWLSRSESNYLWVALGLIWQGDPVPFFEKMRLSKQQLQSIQEALKWSKKMKQFWALDCVDQQLLVRCESWESLAVLDQIEPHLDSQIIAFRSKELSSPIGPQITGALLLKWGLTPGPQFSKILHAFNRLRLERAYFKLAQAQELLPKVLLEVNALGSDPSL